MNFESLYTSIVNKELASKYIIRNHYTHRWPIVEFCMGLYKIGVETNGFFNMDKLLGVIAFGPVAGANVCKSISPMLQLDQLWELKRLCVEDSIECGKNTESWFISQAIDYIRQHHKDIKCLVSYADGDAGHRGVIYQATNFIYQDIEREQNTSGYTFSFDEGKTWLHPRTLFNKYGTFNEEKLIATLPRPFWVKELSVKHRYVYPLGDKIWRKKLIKSFNHPAISYLKENQKSGRIKKYDCISNNRISNNGDFSSVLGS